MRRLVALCMGICLAVGITAAPVTARQPVAVSGMDVLTSLVDEGRCWTTSNGSNHCRGWTGAYETTGDPLVAGTSVVVANWNFDAIGGGSLWGTADVTLADGSGGWHESWVAKADQGGLWAGPSVGHGWGSLDGMQIRLDVSSTGPGLDQFEGFVFQPGG